MPIKGLFEKVELRPVLITLSDTRKVDLSIMSFNTRQFAAPCLNDLHSKHAKMNNTKYPEKRYM